MLEKMAEEAITIGVVQNPTGGSNPPPAKRKRNLPGNPDPEAEVIALSPKTLMATNRFLCEICGKGFQRDQNLQLHRRGHNLPWKLKQRSTSKEIARKRVYVCPEKSCVHHHPSRALGDLTGIKKHFCRKHGEKKWKCDKCSKRYAVQSDWKAHSKTCGTREYKCDCGTVFSRRDSFMTHRAFCDALAEETARVAAASNHSNVNYHFIGSTTPPLVLGPPMAHHQQQHFSSTIFNPISTNEEAIDPISKRQLSPWMSQGIGNNNNLQEIHQVVSCPNPQLNWVFGSKDSTGSDQLLSFASLYSNHQTNSHQTTSVNMSATALLQKAAQIGATTSTDPSLFLGSIHGLKCNNNNQLQLDGNKLCGLYGTSPIAARLGSDVEGSSVNDLSTFNDQFLMYPSKRRSIQNDESPSTGGQTRDFLGVGVRSICHPSSVNGWM